MKEWKRQFMSMERCALLQREAAAKREQARELRQCAVLARVSADRAGIERHAAEFEEQTLILEAKASEIERRWLSRLREDDTVRAHPFDASPVTEHVPFQRVGLRRGSTLIGRSNARGGSPRWMPAARRPHGDLV